MKLSVMFLYILKFSQSVEVIPLKPEIEFMNTKYMKTFKIAIERHGRRSPYYIKLFGETLVEINNNMTISVQLYENLSGNYVPIVVNIVSKFCDFLYNEPILGQMWMKQLPKNLTSCPIAPGYYAVNDIIIHVESISLPFTFAAIDVRARADVYLNHTITKELIIYTKTHLRLLQKPRQRQ